MSTFRKVAHIDGLGLAFTRGYVNLQHSQYNAEKGGLDDFVTYHVGSLGFDGPSLPRPRSYQVPDALDHRPDEQRQKPGLPTRQQVDTELQARRRGPDRCGRSTGQSERVVFRLGAFDRVRFNGGTWRTFAHPYPESTDATRAVTMPVDLADLKSGQNALEMRTAWHIDPGSDGHRQRRARGGSQ